MTARMTLSEWRTRGRDPGEMIRACSTILTPDGMNNITIGMSPSSWRIPDEVLCAPPGNTREVLLYVNIDASTDRERRPTGVNRDHIVQTLARNGFPNGARSAPADFWKTMQQSEFVASPEGNGVDCHRTYEALWAGAIPVVERAHFEHMSILYKGAPILWTDDFSEVTPEYLAEKRRTEFASDKTFDFSCLLMSGLTPGQRKQCTWRANKWKAITNSGAQSTSRGWLAHRELFAVRLKNSNLKPQKHKRIVQQL